MISDYTSGFWHCSAILHSYNKFAESLLFHLKRVQGIGTTKKINTTVYCLYSVF